MENARKGNKQTTESWVLLEKAERVGKMPKWKAFLTIEFTAEVEAYTEEEARDRLFFHIYNGYNDVKVSDIDNIEVKKWWGGANDATKTL